jgi:hypothetical protein
MTGGAKAQDIALSPSVNMRFKGELGVEGWYFPREAPQPAMSDNMKEGRGKLDLTFQFNVPLELRVNQRFIYDFNNSDRNRYEIEDLYLDYFSERFEVRAGFQIFSWKTVESVSQADFLNQTDLEGDFIDPEKLSELALRTRLIPPTGTDQVFEFYYIPRMRPTRFPVGKNRFSFGLNVSNDPDDHLYQSDAEAWRPQFALGYQRSFFDYLVDTRFFYFNGYNRFPGLSPRSFATLDFMQEYRLVHKSGMTFQSEVGAWLIKGEAVYTAYQKDVMNQMLELIRPKYLAYTLGFEYTFYSPLVQNQDLGMILEVIGDTDAGKDPASLEGYRPFRSFGFAGLRYAFNNIGDRSILAGGLFDYHEGDVLLSIEYDERIAELWTLNLTYTDLMAESSPLDLFGHADRLKMRLDYHF